MAKTNDKAKGKKPVGEEKANTKKGKPVKADPKSAKGNADKNAKTTKKPTETRKKK